MTARNIAEKTFEAIRENRFYICSHPHRLEEVRQRMEDLLVQRNPSDPLAAQLEVRARLEALLRD